MQVGPAGCSSKRRYRIVHPELGQTDDVHVPLYHNTFFPDTDLPAGTMQSVEFRALVKQRCFRRIQIFGVTVTQRTLPPKPATWPL